MADENKKGITVKIDAALHAQVKEYIESRGMTMAEFITAACDDLLHPKITEKEDKKMENMRTVAFQVPESLFQRIKDYLQRNNMTQRQFLLGLIEAELDQDLTEREAAVEAVSDDQEQEDTVLSEGEIFTFLSNIQYVDTMISRYRNILKYSNSLNFRKISP